MSRERGRPSRTNSMPYWSVTFNDGYQMGVMAVDEVAALRQADRTEAGYRTYYPNRKKRKAVSVTQMSENESIRKMEWARIRENNRLILSKTDQKVRSRYKARPTRNKDKKEGNDEH
jgi:hypothetical protein